MLRIIYDIVIQPLVYLIEFVFAVGYRLTDSPGLAIVGVSAAVNLLSLPLYRMADAIQEQERARQEEMAGWVNHIKRAFTGDERVMVLSEYYRQQNYKPYYQLRSSISLLLQIPFFMAAYSYLSELTLLRGASFLFLSDLGNPDGLLEFGGYAINLMPILMTGLNCAATAVYTRGMSLGDKVRTYGLALVFLVLLYDSPSGLVFYWTCNQLFSLGKNVFMKVVPNPRKWALLLAQACVLGACGWLVAAGKVATPRRAFVLALCLAFFEVLWVFSFMRSLKPETADGAASRSEDVATKRLDTRTILASSDERHTTFLQFFSAAALLAVMVGLLIPSALIADSPTEFMVGFTSPIGYIVHAACVWAGFFMLWWGTFFLLSDDAARKWHALTLWLLCGVCLLDYFAFGRNLGTITTALKYDNIVRYPLAEVAINLVAIAALLVALYAVWRWRRSLVLSVTCVVALTLAVMSAVNVHTIATSVADAQALLEENGEDDLVLPDGTPRQIFHLSRTNKNVVLIYLDRAISSFVPYIMAERPELEAQFDGFVYYPNTLSHGWFTNYGAPGLFGGYEYVPSAMNARPDELLADKHNEALMLMPTLMSKEGLRTTVIDPPLAGNYTVSVDLSMYDQLDNTEAYKINGAYTELVQNRLNVGASSSLERKFVFYGLFKVAPELVQPRIYDKGLYMTPSKATYPSKHLRDELSVLELLPELTETESDTGGFVLLYNNTTHEQDFLQLPDYEISNAVNNSGLEDYGRFELNGTALTKMTHDDQRAHYHVNAAALIRLGRWFDWMREQGVWDNTRIIIAADHGRGLQVLDDLVFDDYLDVVKVNPLLMVKDFGASGFVVSDEFMTNADAPTLSMEGIVENPVNPFTGKPIDSSEKEAHDQLVTLSSNFSTKNNHGKIYDTSDAPWYSVHDNIFDKDNWTRYETYEDAVEAVPQ